MPGACLNSYRCEWSIGYLWRWMNWFGHLDVIVLALLLAYTLAVFIRVSYRYHVARQARVIDSASRRKLAAELNIEVGNLKSIVSTAPYLGLVGTCFGIMSAFRGIAMQKDAASRDFLASADFRKGTKRSWIKIKSKRFVVSVQFFSRRHSQAPLGYLEKAQRSATTEQISARKAILPEPISLIRKCQSRYNLFAPMPVD
jgi:hypothetical protein